MTDKHTRVIYLSQLFDPEPTFKGLAFAKALNSRGFEIEVVTGFPNYPGGKIYNGYRISPLRRQTMDAVDVTRVAIFPSHNRSVFKRILCYSSFFMSSLLYLIFVARKSDIVYVYYPSLTAGLAAIGAKLFRGTPVILDLQDMWPDSLTATGMTRSTVLIRSAGYLSKLLFRRVDHIVVLSPGFRSTLVERGVPEEKVSVIYNWAAEMPESSDTSPADVFDPNDTFRVLFAGNMGAAQGLTAVLDAAQEVAKHRTGIAFYLMGSGVEVENLKQYCLDNHIGNVRFVPGVPLSEVQGFLKRADCLLVHLRKDPLFAITIPSKTQAYFLSGKPILMAVEGDAAELVVKAKAGLVAEPENPRSIAASVLEMFEMGPERRAELGENGRRFYVSELSLAKALDKYETLLLDKRRERHGRASSRRAGREA